jgi:hypothetical protein
MTKDEIIKALRDMARYPTVTLPRDCEALRAAADLLAQPEQTNTRPYYTIDELNAWADEKEKQAWRNAAIRIGEELSSVGPDGYYDMDAWKWLDWAMEQEPRGKNSLAQPEQKRPQNCGTGYCSCVECVMEPEKKFVAKVISTAPERIWLDLGFDPSNEDEISFNDLIEATWSHDNSTGFGIKYVRSDMTPSHRTWVGLTDKEAMQICEDCGCLSEDWLVLLDAIEAKLKSKNT